MADRALQPYDGDSLPSRIFQVLAALLETSFDWFWTVVTRKGRLERILSSSWTSRAAQMVRLERFLREHSVRLQRRRGSRDGEEEGEEEAERQRAAQQEAERVIGQEGVCVEECAERREHMRAVLSRAVGHMDAYEALVEKVEALRSEAYDSGRESHEKRLLKLWRLMREGEELRERRGKQWREIGFQGDDPATDFRGMGVLGLEQLVFIAQFDRAATQHALLLSHHPKIGFPLAVAGITFTSFCRDLLRSGELKRHFYNTLEGAPDMDAFHRVYCRVFVLFCEFWKRAEPESVMQFNEVRFDFESRVRARLARDDADLDTLTVDAL